MDDPTVEHECRRGPKCAARHRTRDNEMHGAGVERPNTLCRACEQHAFDAINELGDDWTELRAVLTAGPTGRSGGRSVRDDRRIPLRVDVEALMTAIETETLRWARIVAPDEPVPDSAGACVRRCVTILGTRTGTLVDLPAREITEWVPHPDGGDTTTRVTRDGVDAVLRLARLHQRAQAVIGTSERRIWLPDPCPRCAVKALTPSKDQERITCQACRQTWDARQFTFLGTVLDFEKRRLKGETV